MFLLKKEDGMSNESRLDGLEKRVARLEEQEDPLPGPSQHSADVFDALARGEPITLTEAGEAERRDAMEKHPAAIILRKEYARLGMPQPVTLDDVDVIEEAIRLARIPT